MTYLVAYACSLMGFVAIDAVWLTTMGPRLYRPLLGDLLAPAPRLPPAIVFYLLYPVGIVVFAVLPGLREDAIPVSLLHGALFGLIAYGTYDLTSQATLRRWPPKITVLDMIFGAVATGIAATIAAYAARWFGG